MSLDVGNALESLQYEVEVDYDKERNKPKEVLAVLLDQLLGSLQSVEPERVFALLIQGHEALESKEIQVSVNDKKLERSLEQFGWTGALTQVPEGQDYLFVVSANLQGQKADAKIEESMNYDVTVDTYGRAIARLSITRKHHGMPGELFNGAPHVSYVRAYVPRGATLLSATGFEFPPEEAFHVPEQWYDEDEHAKLYEKDGDIDSKSGTQLSEAFGKTVFGNWMITLPGQTTTVVYEYELPFLIDMSGDELTGEFDKWTSKLVGQEQQATSRYALTLQKQSGTNRDIAVSITYPDGWEPVWQSHDQIDLGLRNATVDTSHDHDMSLGVIFEQQDK